MLLASFAGAASILGGIALTDVQPRAAVSVGLPLLVSVLIFELVGLSLLWRSVIQYWRRYRRTYSLTNPPVVFCDVLAAYCFGAISCMIVMFGGPTGTSVSPVLAIPGAFVGWLALSLIRSMRPEDTSRLDDVRGPSRGDLPDDPIEKDEDDLLGRQGFVDGLYEQITGLRFSSTFVFGLHGGWGEGKSSILNLLRARLAKTEGLIVVDFNPWYMRGEEAVVAGFYGAIERSVRRRYVFSGLHSMVQRYQKLLTIGVEKVGIRLGLSVPEAPELVRGELELWLGRTGCRLIVIVDDIDRLTDSEVLAVLKLAGLSARLRNSVFVLSFDPVIVRGILADRLKLEPSYLEKIVQKAVRVPPAEQVNRPGFPGDSVT